MLSSLEGAFVLARALRSTEPVEVAGAAAAAAVRDAMRGRAAALQVAEAASGEH
jgi:hypothetical protein